MYYLVWDVAFTKFFITPLTLSRHHKLTASKTLPSRFTMKSTSLKSTLVICLSICRIVRKKNNLDVSGSKTRSQDQFKKKIQLKFKQSGKCYQTAIFIFNQIWIWRLKIILGIHAKEVKFAIWVDAKLLHLNSNKKCMFK